MYKNTLCTFLLSGYLYFGQYYDSSLLDLEGRPVKYRSGIHLEFETIDKGPVFLVESETLMRGSSGTGFYPGQNNYKLGLKQKIWDVEILLERKCLHPVDGRSNGAAAQSYGLIEFRYGF